MRTMQECIGERVRCLRMELHLNGCKFAALMGWKPDYLSRFEHGQWTMIAPDRLATLARILDVSIDSLCVLDA